MAKCADVTINGEALTGRQVWFLTNAVVAFARQLQLVKECNLTDEIATNICLKAGSELDAMLSEIPPEIG